jgi:hypothetical protein
MVDEKMLHEQIKLSAFWEALMEMKLVARLSGEDFGISVLDKSYQEMNPLNLIDELVREYAVRKYDDNLLSNVWEYSVEDIEDVEKMRITMWLVFVNWNRTPASTWFDKNLKKCSLNFTISPHPATATITLYLTYIICKKGEMDYYNSTPVFSISLKKTDGDLKEILDDLKRKIDRTYELLSEAGFIKLHYSKATRK